MQKMYKICKLDILNNLQCFDNTLIISRLASCQLMVSVFLCYTLIVTSFVVEYIIWVLYTNIGLYFVECFRNVMAHAKTRFRPSPKRTSLFKSAGASVQSTAGSRGVRISGSNAGYTTFRGSVKRTGYPLHSPVSPSLPLPCVTMCHQVLTGLYDLSDIVLTYRAIYYFTMKQ
jgi:hypothetical protein